jgi:hypothetical protein
MAEFLYRPKPLPQETIKANQDRLKEFEAYSTWRANYMKQMSAGKLTFELLNQPKSQEFTNNITPKFICTPPSLDLFRKLYTKI